MRTLKIDTKKGAVVYLAIIFVCVIVFVVGMAGMLAVFFLSDRPLTMNDRIWFWSFAGLKYGVWLFLIILGHITVRLSDKE